MFVALEPSKQLSTAALKASDTAGNGRGADQLHAGLRGLRDGWRLHLLGPPRLRGRLYLTRRVVRRLDGHRRRRRRCSGRLRRSLSDLERLRRRLGLQGPGSRAASAVPVCGILGTPVGRRVAGETTAPWHKPAPWHGAGLCQRAARHREPGGREMFRDSVSGGPREGEQSRFFDTLQSCLLFPTSWWRQKNKNETEKHPRTRRQHSCTNSNTVYC